MAPTNAEAGLTGSVSPALASAWQSQRRWSATATALKGSIGRARWAALALAITGATLVLLGAQAAAFDTITGKVLGAAGAVALALAPAVRARWTKEENVRDWVRARSVSESLKAEVYTYLTRSGEYADPDRDPEVLLADRRQELERKASKLAPHAARARPTPKPPPVVSDVDSYVDVRLGDQIDVYYVNGAARKATRLAWLRRIEAGLTLMAAGLGALAVFVEADGVAAWVPVVTAVAGAVTAHIAASRYEQEVVTFYATAQKLIALRDRWRARKDDEGKPIDPSAFVLECENVISSENQEWMADWLESDDGGS